MLSRTVRRIVEAMTRKNRRAMRSRPSSFRPSLEALELRALPSINPIIGDVFYIEMENHNLTQPGSVTSPQQLLGNPAAPYLNSLMTPGNPNAAQTSYASNYYNVLYNNPSVSIHPSEPNYVWQEAAGRPQDKAPKLTEPKDLFKEVCVQGGGVALAGDAALALVPLDQAESQPADQPQV